MKTAQQVHFRDSSDMQAIPSASVELVVTSPPYPMIEMWDRHFHERNSAVRTALERRDGRKAFRLMHAELDPVWAEAFRILKPGGFACINIGDAARTVGGDFMLYPNHGRVLSRLVELGFTPLPLILWRKQTNAPNKFMGSGMYPAGAYVTLEHEYILIARKGMKREFTTAEEKQRRRESAIFWEERNAWFSDVWSEVKGARQRRSGSSSRRRSGAYPFELAFRLISMFSVRGDVVADPFLGTGTTLRAAAAAGRNGIGFELDESFRAEIFADASDLVQTANRRIHTRIADHLAFVRKRRETGREPKYVNRHHRFPVVTRQETELRLIPLLQVRPTGSDALETAYCEEPPIAACDEPAPLAPLLPTHGRLGLF
jgi:DNA modification methylase